jgi:hypothetical protein
VRFRGCRKCEWLRLSLDRESHHWLRPKPYLDDKEKLPAPKRKAKTRHAFLTIKLPGHDAHEKFLAELPGGSCVNCHAFATRTSRVNS